MTVWVKCVALNTHTLSNYNDMNKDLKIFGNPQIGNSYLGAVMWRFSGIRAIDGMKVYGEYPFTYEEGRECYNMAAFWRHVQSGYIDPSTVVDAT